MPLLKQRGIWREAYEADTFRGNLGLDVPVNRNTAKRLKAAEGDFQHRPELTGLAVA